MSKDRENFEAWYHRISEACVEEELIKDQLVFNDDDDSYEHIETHLLWSAWQAALQQLKIDAINERLIQLEEKAI